MKREDIENWLIKNSSLLNYQAIEREVGITKGTLQKFVKYERKLNNEVILILERFIITQFFEKY